MRSITLNNSERMMFSWWSKIRWFIVIVLFAIGLLRVNQTTQAYPTVILVITFVGISILNILFQLQILFPNQIIGAVQIVLDIIFATIVVHLTGGLESHFVWIYLIAIITASLSIEKAGGFISAMIGSMCMLMLVITYNFGWLTPVTAITHNISVPEQTIFLLSYTALFSGMAFISSFISNMLRLLNSHNKDMSEKIESMQKQVENIQQETLRSRENISNYREVVKTGAKISTLDHDINNPLTIISLSIRRVKKAAQEYKDEKLIKSANQMSEAINNINGILVRLQELKRLELIKEERKKSQG